LYHDRFVELRQKVLSLVRQQQDVAAITSEAETAAEPGGVFPAAKLLKTAESKLRPLVQHSAQQEVARFLRENSALLTTYFIPQEGDTIGST